MSDACTRYIYPLCAGAPAVQIACTRVGQYVPLLFYVHVALTHTFR